MKHSILPQDEVDYRINNDLPLDDLLDDNINKYNKDK